MNEEAIARAGLQSQRVRGGGGGDDSGGGDDDNDNDNMWCVYFCYLVSPIVDVIHAERGFSVNGCSYFVCSFLYGII
jgi:hypothetical protein